MQKNLPYLIKMCSKYMLIGIVAQCVFYSLVLAGDGKAQSKSIEEVKVNVKLNDASFEEFTRQVEQQTDFTFFYGSIKTSKIKKLTLKANDQELADVLRQLSQMTGLSFKQVNYSIGVFRDDQSEQVLVEDDQANQVRTVTGHITSYEDSEGLPGANVMIKGTTSGTVTDVNGNYKIDVPSPESVLVFTSVGFISEEVLVGDRSVIDVTLVPDITALAEVVVVGYGTQQKVNLTGSVSSIDSKELENRPITQASQALAGLASGITVSQGSGRPGNDDASIRIRGMGTFNRSGSGNDPLVLIDGLAASINDIDPNNIKSMSVLKDAASASIYGTRAANGVILIETKRGQKGKLQVTYDNYVGWQKVTELPAFLESWEYAQLSNEAGISNYSDDEIALFRSGADPDNYPNVPHLENLLTSGSGFQTNHTIGFRGGDEKNTYLFSLGYLHQDGIVAKNSYDRYNLLLNFDSQIKENLNLKVNLNGYNANTEEPRHYEGEMMHMIAFAVREGPIFAGRKSDGTYGYQDNYSPEAWMDSKSFVNRKNKNFLGGVELAWDVFEDFTLSGKAGYKYFNYTNNSYASNFVFDENKSIGPNNLTVQSGDNSLLTLQSLARYTKKINKHSFNLLAGFSQEEFREDWARAYRDNFPNNELYEINAGASGNMQSGGSGSEWALRSYFGRINYAFNDKYLFEANARYDGTSRFPREGRWGLFPSFSAGWRISEEPFIKDNVSWIYNLKIRGSWGKLGNQNVGSYPYQNVLSLNQNYSIGGSIASGARLTTLANSDITWESTQITDIGLDLDIFEGKLGLVFDYFNKKTYDILYNVSVSKVLGLTPSEVNAGEVKNTGFEVVLDYRTSIGDLNIGFAPNFSYIKNRVTKLAGGIEQDIDAGLFVGHPINSIYGYEADGLFVNGDDIAAYPTQPYSAEPGFIRYKDISGPDGVPDGVVDATYDRKVIGSTFPNYSFGATITAEFKGFDFSLLLHGLAGFEKQMGSYQAFAFYNSGQIQRWQADNRWTEENPDPNAEYVKLTSLNMGSGAVMTSTFWNRNASFLRAKNLQVGYSFSNALIQKLNISSLRVFFSGQNLFSLNSFYEGWDPEMNQSWDPELNQPSRDNIPVYGDRTPFYPITRVYTFGLNVKF